MLVGQIVALSGVFGDMEQLPAVGVQIVQHFGGDLVAQMAALSRSLSITWTWETAHRPPAIVVDSPAGKHLKVLGVVL